MKSLTPFVVSIFFVSVFGCGDPVIDDKPPVVVVEDEIIMVDRVSVFESTPECEVITPDETVVSVSPEGDLWLASDMQFRVVGPSGERLFETRLTDVTVAQAWDDQNITFRAGDDMWHLNANDLEPIYLPTELGVIDRFCGDIRKDGDAYITTASGLYERSAGAWWKWNPPGGEFGEISWLAKQDGACTSANENLWMGAGEFSWRLSPTEVRIFGGMVGGSVDSASLFKGGLAAISNGTLWIGTTTPPEEEGAARGLKWQQVEFSAGTPNKVVGSGDTLFVQVGPRVFFLRGQTWAELDHGMSSVKELWPSAANTLWMEVGEGRVCKIKSAEEVVVRGIRPLERRTPKAEIRIFAEGDEASLSIDGGAAMSLAKQGGRFDADIDLGSAGWHTMDLAIGSAARSLDYYIAPGFDVSWETDMKPIFDEWCSGAKCHGPHGDDPPADMDDVEGQGADFASYEDWKAVAGRIRMRVTDGSMPKDLVMPVEKVTLIRNWVDGGTKP